MIGNDRLYTAVRALATSEGDVRARVCLALSILAPLRESEFLYKPALWQNLKALKAETSSKGPLVINGKIIKDGYQNTASLRNNKTYKKYAQEIFAIWLETCGR
jgi:hypothetical protein